MSRGKPFWPICHSVQSFIHAASMLGKSMDMNCPHPFVEGYLFVGMVEDGLPSKIWSGVGESLQEQLVGGVFLDGPGEVRSVT